MNIFVTVHNICRLYQTPAVVTRAPKPGEAIMSMEGSPITNVGASNPSAGILVPIDSSRVCYHFSFLLKIVFNTQAVKTAMAGQYYSLHS